MGYWGTSLYSNDTSLDVRDSYISCLEQNMSDDIIVECMKKEYAELLGTDEEIIFWLSLADTQWKWGRLSEYVKDRAVYFIDSSIISIGSEDSVCDSEKIIAELSKLKDKLISKMPMKKNISKNRPIITNPWNVGDVYAYRFHTSKNVDEDFLGKYILFQKIGNVEFYEGVWFSVVRLYNKLFSNIPSVDKLRNIDILPFAEKRDEYIPPFSWYQKATMIYERKNQYPQKNFFFVGNIDLEKEDLKANQCDSFYLDKNRMEEWLSLYYKSWNA